MPAGLQQVCGCPEGEVMKNWKLGLSLMQKRIETQKWSDPEKYTCKGQHAHTLKAYWWGALTHIALLAILPCFADSFL